MIEDVTVLVRNGADTQQILIGISHLPGVQQAFLNTAIPRLINGQLSALLITDDTSV